MKESYQILIIILIHYIGDFLFQTEDMATNKSKSNYWLMAHVTVYSFVWIIIGLFFYPLIIVMCFALITFICHFITDYFTSRWTGRLYMAKKYYGFPAFFSVIGLDQVLHYAQLIICYEFLKTI